MTDHALRRIKTLTNPLRIEILYELNFREGRARVTDIAQALNLAPNSVSYHLRELAKVGVVRKAEPAEGADFRESWYELVEGGVAIDEPSRGDAITSKIYNDFFTAFNSSSAINRFRERAIQKEAELDGESSVLLSVLVARLSAEERDAFSRELSELIDKFMKYGDANDAAMAEELKLGSSDTRDKTERIYLKIEKFPIIED